MDTREKVMASHNDNAGKIVRDIVRPTLEAGGDIVDVIVLLESVIMGVVLLSTKLGGDDDVLDTVTNGVKIRLAEHRLKDIKTAGNA